MHAAGYVSNDRSIAAQGRLGRSWGCPAVRPAIAKKLFEAIKGGSLVVAYYPDAEWLGAVGVSVVKRLGLHGTADPS